MRKVGSVLINIAQMHQLLFQIWWNIMKYWNTYVRNLSLRAGAYQNVSLWQWWPNWQSAVHISFFIFTSMYLYSLCKTSRDEKFHISVDWKYHMYGSLPGAITSIVNKLISLCLFVTFAGTIKTQQPFSRLPQGRFFSNMINKIVSLIIWYTISIN